MSQARHLPASKDAYLDTSSNPEWSQAWLRNALNRRDPQAQRSTRPNHSSWYHDPSSQTFHRWRGLMSRLSNQRQMSQSLKYLTSILMAIDIQSTYKSWRDVRVSSSECWGGWLYELLLGVVYDRKRRLDISQPPSSCELRPDPKFHRSHRSMMRLDPQEL